MKGKTERKELSALRPLLLGILVFVLVGFSLANEMLGRFGLEDNYVVVFSAAFIIAILLLSKNIALIAVVAAGVVMVNMPEATLASYNLDRDFLLALVCAIVLVPSLYALVTK